MTAEVLVACIGNVFLHDDGFGSAVARELSRSRLPREARVSDYGIRGMRLASHLLESEYRALVLVDALAGEQRAGSLRLLRLDSNDARNIGGTSAPSITPAAVLAFVDALGGTLPRTFVVGCQPVTLAAGIGLSPPVSSAVGEAVRMVRDVVTAELPCERGLRGD